MSTKTAGKANDFLEILMLTGFFCAIFFACWGGYLAWDRGRKVRDRNMHQDRGKRMHEYLSAREQRDRMMDYLRIKDSERDAGTMLAAVTEVLDRMGPNRPELVGVAPGGRTTSGTTQVHEARVTFKPGAPLRHHVTFLGALKSEKPHLNVKRLNMNRKTGRNDADADTWDVSLDLIAFVTALQEDAANKP